MNPKRLGVFILAALLSLAPCSPKAAFPVNVHATIVSQAELAVAADETGGSAQPDVSNGAGDALALTLAWIVKGNHAYSDFGRSVGTAGDVNGDGYADVIVGAPDFTNDQTNEGRAYVYFGSKWGLAIDPAWTVEGDQAGARFGAAVGTAGDVNGDGYADVIIGAPNYTNGQENEGRAYVFYGSADGLATTPAWHAEGDRAGAHFGAAVGTAGSVNGGDVHAGDVHADIYADVIVGAPDYDHGQQGEGRAYVYHGSKDGLATTFAWHAESNGINAGFGAAVGTAGDVNGDGWADVIVGAPRYEHPEWQEGGAFVYHGSANGLADTAAWTREGSLVGGVNFGWSVGTAGDVNGDGFADVIIGAPFYSNDPAGKHQAYVYHGSIDGLKTTYDWRGEGAGAANYFGRSVGTAGDVNSDGYADVIVGAPSSDTSLEDAGRAYVYQGSKDGLVTTLPWIAEGDQYYGFFGSAVGAAGNVNGDGYADVIVGMPAFRSRGHSVGAAFVYQGTAALVETCVVNSTADSGPGTLRACLTAPQPGQAIRFDLSVFPPAAPAAINLLSALPAITADGLSIDASSAGVILDGHLLTGSANGLYINGAAGVHVHGLQILGFPNDGIELGNGASGVVIGGDRGIGSGAVGQGNLASGNRDSGIKINGSTTRDNTVLGNLVGTDLSGTTADGNGRGIAVEGASHILIGGASPDTRNVVSGNANCGVLLNTSASNNCVAGNLIGTDIVGRNALGNEWDGVCIWNRASYNIIGGDDAAERNVISGNSSNGVTIGNVGVFSNTVSGNLIGTDVDGLKALGNGAAGIMIADRASFNVVGGVTSAERNLISGNKSEGVIIADLGTTRNSVVGNYIGTDITGETRLANDYNGILIWRGAVDNMIGGATNAHGNLISGNRGHGVAITGPDTRGNRIELNLIGTRPGGTQGLGNAWNGVLLDNGANNTVIRRNLISGNIENGIWIRGLNTASNILIGNKMGSSLSGTKRVPNQRCGVAIDTGASDNRIGGPGSDEGNLISGNGLCGLLLNDSPTSKNLVVGNFIGTDIDGISPLSNGTQGVSIWGGASDNTIGGSEHGERNVISGNGENGIQIGGQNTEHNKVIGNYVGTDKDGAKAIPNGGNGVILAEGASNTLLDRNLISGNAGEGVNLTTTGNEITGNKIGTDASGLGSLGNRGNGIYARADATKSTIGPTNIIAFNLNGVYVDGSQTLTHKITANSIFSNLLAGIKLDNGGNGGIASPRIISATCTHASGTAPPNVTIELFSDAEDEGRVYEGTTTSWPSGGWEFNKARAFRLGRLTATHTDAAGNTSEFSTPYQLPGCASTYLPLVHKPAPTPTPTRTPTPTASPSPTPSLTPTATATPKYFEGPWEAEPNNPGALANGPLRSGRDYFGYPNDSYDYFFFDVHTPGQIVVDLANHTGKGVQLQLYYLNSGKMVDIKSKEPYHIEHTGQAGRYVIVIYTESDFNNSTPYTLRATFP